MAKRVGANRQKMVNEQRARRPRRIAGIIKIAGIAILVLSAGFAIYTCSPAVTGRISSVVHSGSKVSNDMRIINCDVSVAMLLRDAVSSQHAAAALSSQRPVDSVSLDKAEIIKAAAQIHEIEKINITKTKDGGTIIKVTERKPVAILHSGVISLVDKKGVRFAAVPGRYYDLPLISTDIGQSDTVNLETFDAIKKASRDMGGAFFQQISQIELLGNGDVKLIFKSGKTEYTLNSEDMEKRLFHVKKLLERFQEEDAEPAHIDLRYKSLAFSSM